GVRNMFKGPAAPSSTSNRRFPKDPASPKVGFAKGGVFNAGGGVQIPTAAHFDIGDVFEKAKDVVGKISSLSPAGLVTKGLKFTKDFIWDKGFEFIWDKTIGKWLDKAMSWLKSKFALGGELAGGVGMYVINTVKDY